MLLAHGAPDSPQVASARADLGTLLRLMHRRYDALAMLKQANEAFGKMSSPDRGQVVVLAGLSETELDDGDAAAAEASAESAVALARRILPSGHFLIAAPLFALARADLAERRSADAEPLLREALSLRMPIEPAADPRVLEIKVALVDALEAEGRASAARAMRAEVEAPLRASRSPYAADLRARLALATSPPSVAGRVSAR
jgi:serine/threonine-protein kinase